MTRRANNPHAREVSRPHRRARRSPRDRGLSTGEYLQAWLAARQTLRPATRLAYDIHIRRYLTPHLGEIPLAELSVFDIESMYRAIECETAAAGHPLSAATMQRVHATLMSALSSAVRRDLLARNPALHVELRRAAAPVTGVWSAEQLGGFLDAICAHRLHALFLLYALTGMRRGEGVGLRWSDVDLDAATLRVQQQIVVVGSQLLTGAPKTSTGRRTIAAPDTLTRALRHHARGQAVERDTAGAGWHDTGLVFTTTDGRALNPAHVSREFTRLTTAHGLPVIRLHDLRHTSASLGLATGETLLEVSRRLGHSSIAITADVYSHVAPVTARASADRLAALLTLTLTELPTAPDAGAKRLPH